VIGVTLRVSLLAGDGQGTLPRPRLAVAIALGTLT